MIVLTRVRARYILSDPTPERLARMLLVGQQSAFPKLLFIENRMKIERLIEKGLLLGGSAKVDIEGNLRDRETIGHVMRSSTEQSTEDEDKRTRPKRGDGRASVIQELKRQSSIFYDDSEDTGMSESEAAVT